MRKPGGRKIIGLFLYGESGARGMRRRIIMASVFCWMLTGLGRTVFADWRSDAVRDAFLADNVQGTLIVESLDGTDSIVHDESRAAERFSPASTFKIVNTLIGLDQQIVTSRHSRFAWDGVERDVPAWNRDQTLASAFAVSCVWCYQEIARRAGPEVYRVALERLEYGNGQVGDAVDNFWLNGVLRISAREQIEVLRRIVSYNVPYSREHVDELRAIMLLEQGQDYRLYAKTGWTGPALHVGWFVGFVETDASTWLFAMNMDMDAAIQAPLRKEVVLRSLRALGLL